MSQATVVMPTSGIVSGVNFATDVNNGFDAVRTMWSGASAPAGDAPEQGQLWCDTSLAPQFLSFRVYDGANWVRWLTVDTSAHDACVPIGGGLATVASAATTTIGGASVPEGLITISGTATITSFGTAAQEGQIIPVTFSGVATLTYNATSLILPGQANIVTAAGDMALLQYKGGGNWQCLIYQPIATLLGSVGTVTGAFITNNIVTPAQLTASQNNYAPSGVANAAVLELTTNGGNFSITGLTSGVSGRQLMIRNANATGGGKISFPTGSTLSSTGNRFAGAIPVTINPGQQADFMWDLSAGAWVSQNVVAAQPVQGARRNLQCGTVSGGFTFTGSTNSNTRYRITADQLTLNDVDGNAVVASALDVTADATLVGAGGLDSTAGVGFTSSAFYSAWAIFNPVTLSFSALLSTSITSPVMPSGYTFKTRVGWSKTGNTANFNGTYQADRVVQYDFNAFVIGSGTFGTISSAAWTPSVFAAGVYVPPTASRILFTISQGPGGGAIGIAPGSSISFTGWGAGSGGLPPVPYAIGTNISTSAAQAPVAAEFTLWSTNIYLASGAPNGAVWLRGWEDNL